MAVNAVLLRNVAVHLGNAEWFGEVPRREGQAVVETVDGLDPVLCHNAVVRCVAVIAGGNGFVAAVVPGRIDIPHNMTIGAGSGIIRKIGDSLGIHKGVRT